MSDIPAERIANVSSADAAAADVNVLDSVVQQFHWTLALCSIANLTFLGEVKPAHKIVGYVILCAIAIRMVLGFVGTRHARFSDVLTGPRTLLAYLGALTKGRAPRYIGRNPAGALMMIPLVGLATVCGVTGITTREDAFWAEGWVGDIHEAAANFILGLAILHVLAAVLESWHHRENLVRSMIAGRKRAATGTDIDHAPPAH